MIPTDREVRNVLKAPVIPASPAGRLTTKCSEAECRRKELPDEGLMLNNESLANALLAVGRPFLTRFVCTPLVRQGDRGVIIHPGATVVADDGSRHVYPYCLKGNARLPVGGRLW